VYVPGSCNGVCEKIARATEIIVRVDGYTDKRVIAQRHEFTEANFASARLQLAFSWELIGLKLSYLS
jgi:hypothetical protein